MIIRTLTLNPAIDESITLQALILGGVNRCGLDALDPGGKGVNASRVIARLGRQTIAFGFVGGVTGQLLREKLDRENVPHAFDDVEEQTRINIMLYERAGGRRSRLYLPGARVEPAQIERLKDRFASVATGDVIILGGSVPPGLPPTIYRELITWFKSRGARIILDTSGVALASALEARPTLIKPNVEEAAELLGRSITSDDDALRAARELRDLGAEIVVISQGPDGAVGLSAAGAWKAIAPRITTRSTIGSGDSMVAGLAIAMSESDSFEEGLRLGTAAGAATAMILGTHLCRLPDVETLLSKVVLAEVNVAA